MGAFLTTCATAVNDKSGEGVTGQGMKVDSRDARALQQSTPHAAVHHSPPSLSIKSTPRPPSSTRETLHVEQPTPDNERVSTTTKRDCKRVRSMCRSGATQKRKREGMDRAAWASKRRVVEKNVSQTTEENGQPKENRPTNRSCLQRQHIAYVRTITLHSQIDGDALVGHMIQIPWQDQLSHVWVDCDVIAFDPMHGGSPKYCIRFIDGFCEWRQLKHFRRVCLSLSSSSSSPAGGDTLPQLNADLDVDLDVGLSEKLSSEHHSHVETPLSQNSYARAHKSRNQELKNT